MEFRKIMYPFEILEILPSLNNFTEDFYRTLKLDLVPGEVSISFFYTIFFWFLQLGLCNFFVNIFLENVVSV